MSSSLPASWMRVKLPWPLMWLKAQVIQSCRVISSFIWPIAVALALEGDCKCLPDS